MSCCEARDQAPIEKPGMRWIEPGERGNEVVITRSLRIMTLTFLQHVALASYPRSGNTLMRSLLEETFRYAILLCWKCCDTPIAQMLHGMRHKSNSST